MQLTGCLLQSHAFHMSLTAVVGLALFQGVTALVRQEGSLDLWAGVLMVSAVAIMALPICAIPWVFGGTRALPLNSEAEPVKPEAGEPAKACLPCQVTGCKRERLGVPGCAAMQRQATALHQFACIVMSLVRHPGARDLKARLLAGPGRGAAAFAAAAWHLSQPACCWHGLAYALLLPCSPFACPVTSVCISTAAAVRTCCSALGASLMWLAGCRHDTELPVWCRPCRCVQDKKSCALHALSELLAADLYQWCGHWRWPHAAQ